MIYGKPIPDESAQWTDFSLEITRLAQEAIKNGYDPHPVAEGLLEAARLVLADNHEFTTVYERFWKRWNLKR